MAADTPWMKWMAHTASIDAMEKRKFSPLLGIELLFRCIEACIGVSIMTCLFHLLYGYRIKLYYITCAVGKALLNKLIRE
jgi:hypothetical protein